MLMQCCFVIGYVHIAFNRLACAGLVGWLCVKISVNRIFHLGLLSAAVLYCSRDQRSLLLRLSRLPYSVESPFEFSLDVTVV